MSKALPAKFIAVDADSIEKDLRRIIIDSCIRFNIEAVFVSCKILPDIQQAHLKSNLIYLKIVKTDFDSADNFIFNNRDKIFFCISHDRILSQRLLTENIKSIDKRGYVFSFENDKNLSNIYEKARLKDREEFSKNLEKLIKKSLF